MFLLDKEHNPPHIHALYGDTSAAFKIENGELMKGEFPKRGKKLVKEFINHYKVELLEMWESGVYYKLPPLK